MTNNYLESDLKKVSNLRDKGSFDEAWQLVDKLCEEHPQDIACWKEASFLASHQANYNKAVHLITKAIELTPDEPALFFKRSRDNLLAGKNMHAIEDVDIVLQQSIKLNSNYYVDMALFYKAEALYRNGDHKQAHKIALHLPAGIGYWLDNNMRTREDILNDTQNKS